MKASIAKLSSMVTGDTGPLPPERFCFRSEAGPVSPVTFDVLRSLLSFYVITLFLTPSTTLQASTLADQIEKVEKTYGEVSNLTADFTQKTEVALLDKVIARTGKLFYQKGGKIRIEYVTPEKKNYVSDGKYLWIYIPGDRESLMQESLSNEVVSKEALSFLSGFGRLKKEFHVSSSKAFTKDQGRTALHLKPRSKQAPFTSLDALFNERHFLEELQIQNRSGNTTHYRFSKITSDERLPDSLFFQPAF